MGEKIPEPVKKCVAILKVADSDTAKFAGLFMVTKLVKAGDCSSACKKALFEAIGFKFLKKLLLSSEVPIDCPPLVYKSVALSILSCFCSDPEIATHQEMLANIPVFLEVIEKAEQSDDDDLLMVISESYECLKHIASYPAGQKAFLKSGVLTKLPDFYIEQCFQCDEALSIFVLIVGCQGPVAWGTDPKIFHSILNKMSLDFKSDQSEKKFELCSMLYTLLFNCPRDFIDASTDEEIWPSSTYKGITEILTSKIGKTQRDPALKLASIVVELLGVEWCLADEERPKQFFLLLVQLCSVEVRMQLEDRTLKQVIGNAELITSCFTIMELAIAFVASGGKIDLEEKEKQTMYTGLKGAFNAVITLLTKMSKELPDGGSGPERIFTCALVRVLAAWLAQETSANRNAVIAMLPFILKIANETFRATRARRLASKTGSPDLESEESNPWGHIDVLRLLLPALCHLAVDDKARSVLFQVEEDEVLFECISYHWSIVNYKRPPVPKSERKKVRAPDAGPDAKTLAEMADSRIAMISACNIFMNLTVLEPKRVESSPLFDRLLKFVMDALPEVKSTSENLVLQGHLAVFGLLLMKQLATKARKNDFSICRYVQSVIRFLWDAYVIDEGRETTVSTGSLVVSMTYKEHWIELSELWFLGMQTMSGLLSQLPWVSEFAVETGWVEGTAIMLRKVRVGALPHNIRAAYEDFLCQMLAANKDVAELLKSHDILTTCRTHRLMELGKRLFGE
ncbi:neurochondrin homolog [Hetaerina americana]|uniref:neurochondrin homolog n=1 Tax=Hetaerina americana TaxID=62018 RepID=UPI003A7F3D07